MTPPTYVDPSPRRRRPGRPGIGLRLLAAQAIVLAAGAATTTVVAAVVGPPLFREHLHRAGVPMDSLEEVHAEEAYGYATVISIGGALAGRHWPPPSWSASTSVDASTVHHRSRRRGLDVAEGNYDIRVSPPCPRR